MTVLVVTTILAIAQAPAIAYGVPLGTLLLVARDHLQIEVGSRRARAIERRSTSK